ncbi:hypothetical protein [Tardiphaga sp. 367_B4_N1_1]|uniref:hypothetical protein n=1 Tax=Tardiphaga sp. 367_B4_N1_1 TaxID=3240777 RepID=UPI003F1F5F4A
MPQWMQDLTAGWPMIRANLPTFIVLAALMFGAIWWLMDWRYGGILTGRDGIISNKDSEIALLKGQRDDYKDKLSGATPDQAKARIDALEGRLKQIEQTGPRSLAAEQRQALTQTARVPVGAQYALTIVTEGGCPDCPVYASILERAFRDAGWKIGNGMLMGPPQRPVRGIALVVPDAKNLSAEALLIQRSLRAAQIDVELMSGYFMQNMPETELLITAVSH